MQSALLYALVAPLVLWVSRNVLFTVVGAVAATTGLDRRLRRRAWRRSIEHLRSPQFQRGFQEAAQKLASDLAAAVEDERFVSRGASEHESG
jgi:hypothetical protein